jgi:hypothetical protein
MQNDIECTKQAPDGAGRALSFLASLTSSAPFCSVFLSCFTSFLISFALSESIALLDFKDMAWFSAGL